ncbi:MAG: LamG domain-containing protein, partial [Planctomycetota bacterium]|nr:LamG domain-containing protein [Planctomycetota bacterium]
VAELEEGACLELANWYLEVSEKASPSGRGAILGKGLACCQRYLDVHAAQDVPRLKAGMLLETIDKAANKGGPLEDRVAMGLVLYFSFDKNDPARVAYTPQGRKGGGYCLSGANEHISVPNSNSLEIRDKLTLAAWVNLGSLGPGGYGNEHGYVINKGCDLWWNPAFSLGYAKGGTPLFHVGNAVEPQRGGKSVSGVTPMAAGRWVHLAGVYDGATLKIYVNGRLEGTEKYSGPIRSDKAPVNLGGGSLRGVDWGNNFTVHGTLDEVMIFNHALTPAQIRQLCQGGGG